MRYQNLFFDLDGTIMKTDEGVINAMKYAAKKLNLPDFPYDRTDWYIGPSLESFFVGKIGYTIEQSDKIIEAFREHYTVIGKFECKPYEGLIELMNELNELGANVYVCTAKPQNSAEDIAEKFGFFKCCKAILGSHDKVVDKVDILREMLCQLGVNPSECVMIGDRYTDLDGGRQNGTATVGVLYGYGTMQELNDCQPNYIAKSVADLRNHLLADER